MTILNNYVDTLLTKINELKVIKECYQLRLHLIGKDYASKDEYERNEVDILRYRTLETIAKLDETINSLEQEFTETYGRMIEELEFQDKEIV